MQHGNQGKSACHRLSRFELGAVLAVDAMASRRRRQLLGPGALQTIRTSSLLDPDPVQRQWWLTSAEGPRSEIACAHAARAR